MKNLSIYILLLLAGFTLSSCERVGTQYEIMVYNTTSYPLILEYETVENKEEVRLSNSKEEEWTKMIYLSYFDEIIPEYTDETFKEVVYTVKIRVVLENGEELSISKNFTDIEDWVIWDRNDDQTLIHKYSLEITDEDLEQ